MKLINRGYTEKKVQLRHLTIAELKLHIIDRYVRRGEQEVKLIDITSGDIEVFKNIADVTKNEWCGDCEIEVLNMPHLYGEEIIFIFQESPSWDEFRVIK